VVDKAYGFVNKIASDNKIKYTITLDIDLIPYFIYSVLILIALIIELIYSIINGI